MPDVRSIHAKSRTIAKRTPKPYSRIQNLDQKDAMLVAALLLRIFVKSRSSGFCARWACSALGVDRAWVGYRSGRLNV
jgi:hypothetical protein